MHRVLLSAVWCVLLSVSWATAVCAEELTTTEREESGESNEEEEGIQWFAVPTFGTAPETGFYIGAVGILVFPTNGSSIAQRTSLDTELQVTVRRQVRLDSQFIAVLGGGSSILDTNLHLGIEPNFFYSVGNVAPTEDDRELYDARKLELGGGYKYALDKKKRLFLGAFYQFTAITVDPGMRLADPMIVGNDGGIVSTPGLEVYWDARDSALLPRSGTFANVRLERATRLLGSSFDFTRLTLDARGYLDLGRDHVLAGRALGIFGSGETPFFDMAMLGGESLMRGTFQGRFRDRNLMALQGEYRSPLVWRLRFNAFSALGRVADTPVMLDPTSGLKWTTGGGMRIKIDTDVYMRLDFSVLWAPDPNDSGLYVEETGFYIGANEAF